RVAEAPLAAGVGATVAMPPVRGAAALPPEHVPLAALTSESASRVLVAAPPEAAEELEALTAEAGVPLARLGTTGGATLSATRPPDPPPPPLPPLRDASEGPLPHALGDPV